jgi:hypothetical protein
MKPFDLEKALAGEPVITRAGRPAKIAGYSSDVRYEHRVLGWVDNQVRGWYENGNYDGISQHPTDLFMAEKPKVKKEGWVNVYNRPDASLPPKLSNAYIDEASARKSAIKSDAYVDTVKIEWEE